MAEVSPNRESAVGAQKSGFVISDQKVRRSARNFVAMAAMELTMRFMVLVLSVH
jgi:hypothetical protein